MPDPALRLIFGPDRSGNPPTREKMLERALEQIEGNARLACDILGPDNPGGRSWSLIVDICRATLAAASVGRHAERQDAEERLGPQDEHAVPAQQGDAQPLDISEQPQ